MWTALAILIVGVLFVAALYRLGQRFLELYAGETGAPLSRSKNRTTATDPDGDDAEEVDNDQLLLFLKDGVDSLARQQFQDWVEERRTDGLSDPEILEELRNREPVVIL